MSNVGALLRSYFSPKRVATFNHVANVVIYHAADCAHVAGKPGSRSARWVARSAKKEGGVDSYAYALREYNNFIQAVASLVLDAQHSVGYDYWGGMCFRRESDLSNNPGLPFAGDTGSVFMLFNSYAAVLDYVEHSTRLKGRLKQTC
jgi:hypothetical protein